MRKKVILLTILLASFGLNNLYTVSAEESSKAVVGEMIGQVRFKNPGDTEWKTAVNGTELSEGAQIFVGQDSECQLAMGNTSKSVTKIKQETRAILTSLGDDIRLDVSSGEIFALFKRLDPKSTFKVGSATAVAAVRGTAFSFAAQGIGSDVSSTVQVYEHTVALSSLTDPDKEISVEEGRGVVMGAAGDIVKQFELSPEDMRAATEFMEQAANAMLVDGPAVENKPLSESKVDEPKKEDDDKNVAGGSPPNGPPPGDSGDRPGSFERAMDGVMETMAFESEMTPENAFTRGSMNHMVSNLSELSSEPLGKFEPGAFAEAMESAFKQSDYYQSQAPEMQQQMSVAMETYIQRVVEHVQTGYFPDAGKMEGDQFSYTQMSDERMNQRGEEFAGTFENYYNAVDNPYFQTTYAPTSIERLTQMDFFTRLQAHYTEYKVANLNNMSGYFGQQQTTQFGFVYEGTSYAGSISYVPLADTSPADGNQPYHEHNSEFTIHLQEVKIYNAQDGSSGTGQIVAIPTQSTPANILEIPVPAP